MSLHDSLNAFWLKSRPHFLLGEFPSFSCLMSVVACACIAAWPPVFIHWLSIREAESCWIGSRNAKGHCQMPILCRQSGDGLGNGKICFLPLWLEALKCKTWDFLAIWKLESSGVQVCWVLRLTNFGNKLSSFILPLSLFSRPTLPAVCLQQERMEVSLQINGSLVPSPDLQRYPGWEQAIPAVEFQEHAVQLCHLCFCWGPWRRLFPPDISLHRGRSGESAEALRCLCVRGF